MLEKSNPGEVLGARFSPDGTQIATTHSGDGNLRVWSVADGHLLYALTRAEMGITALAWSADSARIAIGSAAGTIEIWDAQQRTPTHTIAAHSGQVAVLSFSPDGALLASGGSDRSVRLWNVAQGTQRGTPLQGHNDTVLSLAFSPTGQTLASSGLDGAIFIWRLADRSLAQTWMAHAGGARSLVFSHDGRRLASSGEDKAVTIWSTAADQLLDPALETFVRAAALQPEPTAAPEAPMPVAATATTNLAHSTATVEAQTGTVITSNGANVRRAPQRDAARMFKLPQGTVVEIIEGRQVDDELWYFVRSIDGEGWVLGELIEQRAP